jgi:hypothetical protein
MARPHFYRPVQDEDGDFVSDLTVSVMTQGTDTPFPDTIYVDREGPDTYDSTFSVPSGIIEFYLEESAVVRLAITHGSAETIFEDVPVGSPFEAEAMQLLESVSAELAQKSPLIHDHDDRYYLKSESHACFKWTIGDPAPSWADEERPPGIWVLFILNNSSELPYWSLPGDMLFIRPADVVPEIRVLGTLIHYTANVGAIDVVIPDAAEIGDSIWIPCSLNADVVLPIGWNLVAPTLVGAATNSLSVLHKVCDADDAGSTLNIDFAGSTTACGMAFVWKGEVDIDQMVNNVQTADDITHNFPALTPTAESTVVGISGVRYSVVAGAEGTGPRGGWTTLFDDETTKSGAPNRGIYLAQFDVGGFVGIPVPASVAPTEIASQFATYLFSVVRVP